MDDEQELRDATWLQADDDLTGLLQHHGWIESDESVREVTVAGEGNMNWTRRVITTRRSLILKQSRPWVEKFPSIPAPVDRALHELRFYHTVAPIKVVSQQMPRLIGAAPEQYLLVLEDLGTATDGTALYNDRSIAGQAVVDRFGELLKWLAALHQSTRTDQPPSDFQNLALRTLNHEHIFSIPFMAPPALDLDAITPGLAELACWVSAQTDVVSTARELGEAYLAPQLAGEELCLLHGDFFPGSWLYTDDGVKIIDPEFCYFGPPEFDLGILSAHLMMIGHTSSVVDDVRGLYRSHLDDSFRLTIDQRAVGRWAAIEILRRLLGYAQLPLQRDLAEKRTLIELAVNLLR